MASEVSGRIGVMYLISSLEYGGAERQVVELMRHLDRERFDPLVCSLSSRMPLAAFLPDLQRDVVTIEKRGRYDLTTVPRAAALMRQRRVSVVHAFHFDAEMVARLAAPLARVPVVVASERNADYRRPLLHRICLRLTSPLYDVMIANSEAGKRFNQRTLGIPEDRIRVVRNGVDVGRFRPGDRMTVRRELGIGSEVPVVGMVAAFKRQKNHGHFFRVAERVLRRFPAARFLCVGEPLPRNEQRSSDYYREMRQLLLEMGLGESCLLLGNRTDMRAFYGACDVTVLPSAHEGTPNVLLESMACGVPVVATDTADNRHVVGEGCGGFLVPVGGVEPMTERVCDLLADPGKRQLLGTAARGWVSRNFSADRLARETEGVYLEMLRRHSQTKAMHDVAMSGGSRDRVE